MGDTGVLAYSPVAVTGSRSGKDCLLSAQNAIPTLCLWLVQPCLGLSLSLMSLVYFRLLSLSFRRPASDNEHMVLV